jgi:hypothetical protein
LRKSTSKRFLFICEKITNLLQIAFSPFLKVPNHYVACRGNNFIHVGFIIVIAHLANVNTSVAERVPAVVEPTPAAVDSMLSTEIDNAEDDVSDTAQ